ncbi:MAG: hypothetical protein Q9210_003774 [Variospora velana]
MEDRPMTCDCCAPQRRGDVLGTTIAEREIKISVFIGMVKLKSSQEANHQFKLGRQMAN